MPYYLNGNGEFTPDKVELLIIEALSHPTLKWCREDVPTHSWLPVWERDVPIWESPTPSTPTKLQPYFRCRYCHARSKDRSETVASYAIYKD